jgi:hypothetical protein
MYPAVFYLPRPERSSRLLLLLRPLLVLPLFLWSVLYTILMSFVYALAWVVILLSGRNPQLLWDLLEGYYRFRATLLSYTLLLTDKYPPFTGDAERRRGIALLVEYPARFSRMTVLFRPLLLFPHFFFLIGYAALFFFIHLATALTVLFSGRMTEGQHRWLSEWFIYNARVRAYLLLLVDEYPPFNGSQPLAASERIHTGGE